MRRYGLARVPRLLAALEQQCDDLDFGDFCDLAHLHLTRLHDTLRRRTIFDRAFVVDDGVVAGEVAREMVRGVVREQRQRRRDKRQKVEANVML